MSSPHYVPKGQRREDLVQIMEDNFTDDQIVMAVKSMPTAELKEFIDSMAQFHGVEVE